MDQSRSASFPPWGRHDTRRDCEMTPTPPRQPSLHRLKSEAKQRLMDHAPAVIKDVVVSVAGVALFRRRRGRTFRQSLTQWNSMRDLPRADLIRIQEQRTDQIITRASTMSKYYRAKYADVRSSDLKDFPILEKE